ncbi:MAG: carboxypeptidase regulatory-like domain-containing protein [Gammaproteobacteria bacterium]|nr:carboxypeptidase regulatory-like domain-containing protein [Gammaproteobacteria bacterium]
MGLFDFLKVCLFSDVHGVVTLQGKPVAGAEIIRSGALNEENGKAFSDIAFTDEQGHFHFNAKFVHSLVAVIPMEPLVPQKILIRYQGREYLAWSMNKRRYVENAELDKPIRLACEITNPDEVKWFGSTYVKGICKIL